jgi:hypothetical protein
VDKETNKHALVPNILAQLLMVFALTVPSSLTTMVQITITTLVNVSLLINGNGTKEDILDSADATLSMKLLLIENPAALTANMHHSLLEKFMITNVFVQKTSSGIVIN